MKIPVFNITGKKIEDTTLPKEVFGVKVNVELLAQALRIYTSNQHQRSSKVLTRGEVKRTTAKAWRQKGTGRARHGSKRAPIFVGGGVAHGPKSDPKAKLKLSKKMRVIALRSALTSKAGEVIAIEKIDSIKPKTKIGQQLLERIADYGHKKQDRILIVLSKSYKDTLLSLRNLPGVEITQANRLNVYEILKAKKIILDIDSISIIKDSLAAKKS